jgi:hypothetical protein
MSPESDRLSPASSVQASPPAGSPTSCCPEPNVTVAPNRLHVCSLDPKTDPRWESFVQTHPDALIYHHPGWLEAIEREYGQQALHLACEDATGQLVAVLPLFYTRGLPLNLGGAFAGRRISSLPRTPLGGPLSRDPEAAAALLRAATSAASQGTGVQLQIKAQSDALDGLVDGLVRTSWRDAYVLELPGDSAQLRFGNSVTRHRIKWAVNKAIKLGVQVREASVESELRSWYQLYLHAMRRNTVPPRSYLFFQTLWRLLRPKGLMRLLLAERIEDGRPRIIAGSIFLSYGRTFTYAFTGSRRADLALHPNDLIQWTAIHEACKAGFRQYDFGEVPEDHQSLATFKSKWGADALPLYRYYFPAPQQAHTFGGARVHALRRITAAAWQRLPLSMTAFLGRRVYSYL